MLTVWCVCVGDKYGADDVYRLAAMVQRNLRAPYWFRCLSDREIPGIDCLIPEALWPGWWSKLLLFRHATEGAHLYFDLDVVITGDITGLVSASLSLPKNWAQSGYGGCQSSVMAWSGDYSRIADAFDPAQLSAPAGNHGFYGPQQLWGDQEFITALMGAPGECHVEPMHGIVSYKYHCRQGLPAGVAVVCFHGLPKPADVSDRWVVDARRHTRQSAA